MNKIFRVIFNKTTGTWVAVSELVKSQGKTKTEAKVGKGLGTVMQLTVVAASLVGFQSGALAVIPKGCTGDSAGTSLVCGYQTHGNDGSTFYMDTIIGADNAFTEGDYDNSAYVGGTTILGSKDSVISFSGNAGAETTVIGSGNTVEYIYGSSMSQTKGQAVVVGSNNTVYADQAIVMGNDGMALGNSSIAIGSDDADSAKSAISTALEGLGFDGTNFHSSVYEVNQKLQEMGANSSVSSTVLTTAKDGQTIDETDANATAKYGRTSSIGDASIAIGDIVSASGTGSITLGTAAASTGDGSIAVGALSQALSKTAIAYGADAWAQGDSSIAVGTHSQAQGIDSQAIGYAAQALATGTTVLGANSTVGTTDNVDNYTYEPTDDPTAAGYGSLSIGNNNTVTAKHAVVLGDNITSTLDNAVILGDDSSETGSEGLGVSDTKSATISTTRNVTMVNATANGNGSSGYTYPEESGANVYNVTYSNFAGTVGSNTGNFVSVGAVGEERKITNIAAGNISTTSTEAINGSQLYSVVQATINSQPRVEAGDGVTLCITSQNTTYNNTELLYTLDAKDGTAGVPADKLTISSTGAVDTSNLHDDYLVNANSTAQALNNKYFTMTASADENGTVSGASNEQVKAGDEVVYKEGDNIDIKQDGGNFTVGTTETVTFTNMTVTGDNGITMNNTPITELNSTLTSDTDLSTLSGDVLTNAATIGDLVTGQNQILSVWESKQPSVVSGSSNVTVTHDDATNTYTVNYHWYDVTDAKTTSGGQVYATPKESDYPVVADAQSEVKSYNDSFFKLETVDSDGKSLMTDANGAATSDPGTISKGDQITYTAGKNVKIVQVNGQNSIDGGAALDNPNNPVDTISILDDFVVDPKDGKDGKVTIQGTGGEDGSSVVINGADGSIGITGPVGADGTPGASANISVAEGPAGVNGKDGDTKTRIIYTSPDDPNVSDPEYIATLNDGMKFEGNNNDEAGSKTITKQLNETLTIKGEATSGDDMTTGNILVKSNDAGDGLLVELNENLTNLTSATFGSGDTTTVINTTGMTIKTADKTVTLGTTGLDNGGNQITNVASGLGDDKNLTNATGSTLNNGATIGDLVDTIGQIKFNSDPGNFTVTSAVATGSSGSLGSGQATVETVEKDDTVTYTAGHGIQINQDTTNLTFSLESNTSTGFTVGGDGTDGKITANGATGGQVVVDGKDGSIGLNGVDGTNGKDATSTTMTVKEGPAGVNGTDGIARIVYTDPTLPDSGEQYVATLEDGLKFKGDTGDTVAKALDETLTIKGESTQTDSSKRTAENTYVTTDDQGQLVVEMSKNLTGLTSATFGDSTKVSGDGITLPSSTSTDDTPVNVVLNSTGLSNGGNQIVNVASGLGDDADAKVSTATGDTLTNAANIGDLKKAKEEFTGADSTNTFGLTAEVGSDTSDDATRTVKKTVGNTISVIGDTVKDESGTVTSGGLTTNVTTVSNGSQALQIALGDDVVIGNGSSGSDGADGTLTVTGTDGNSVTINGKDGSIGITGGKGESGADGASANITVKTGTSENGAAGLDGSDKDRIVYVDPNNPNDEEWVATVSDGMKYAGDVGSTIQAKLNDTVTLKGGATNGDDVTDANFRVDSEQVTNADGTTDNVLVVKMAKDLTDLSSATFNDGTVISGDGITLPSSTSTQENPTTVTLNSTGLSNGGNQIVNVASGLGDDADAKVSEATGDTLTNAANIGDLQKAKQEFVGETSTDTFGLTAEVGSDTSDDATRTVSKTVGNTISVIGDTVKDESGTVTSGGLTTNVTTVSNGSQALQIALGDDVVIGNGSSGSDGADGTLTVTGTDGNSVTINGKDGSIGITGGKGESGADGASANITVKTGTSENGAAGLDGSDKDRIVYVDPNNPDDEEWVATVSDGMKYAGDVGSTIQAKLNDTVTLKGGATNGDDVTDANFRVDSEQVTNADGTTDNVLVVKMAKDLTDLSSATFNDGTVISGDGITLPSSTSTQDNPTTVTLNSTGLSNGGNQIVNVASGLGDDADAKVSEATGDTLTNAANIGDLQKAKQEVTTVGEMGGFGLKAQVANATTDTVNHDLGNSIQVIGDQVTDSDGNVEKDADGNVVSDGIKTNVLTQTVTNTTTGEDEKEATALQLSLSDNVTVGGRSLGSDATDGVINITGTTGAGVIINAKSGDTGSQGQIVFTGTDGTSTTMTVEKGTTDNGGADLNGNSKDRVTYTDSDGTKEYVATTDDGLNFKGDTGNTISKSLNDTVTLKGGASDSDAVTAANLRVDSEQVTNDDGTTDNVLVVDMAKDLTDLTSATFGDTSNQTKVTGDGVTITDNGKETVSLTSSGLNNGGQQITNVASGLDPNAKDTEDTDPLEHAANIGDLKQGKEDVVSASSPSGGFGLTAEDGQTVKADLGKTIQVVGDESITTDVVSNNGTSSLQIGLGNNVTLGGSDGQDGQDGVITVTGTDGNSVTINGEDGSIGITGAKGASGEDGASATITVKTGTTENGANGLNGEDKDRIVYVDPNNPDTTEWVATMGDGLNFKGDTGDTISKSLNETLTIKGGAGDDADVTDQNFRVDSENGSLVVKMAKNLTDLDSATFGSGNTTTTINNGGVTVTNGDTTVQLTDDGADLGGQRITNVADGTDPTDAITVGQLKQAVGTGTQGLTELEDRLDRAARNAYAGAASAASMANLPQIYLPGHTMLAVAAAGYRGQQGYAAGVSSITDNGNWVLKGSVSSSSQGHFMYGAGAGYQW